MKTFKEFKATVLSESEVPSADRKVGRDGRLYPARRVTVGKSEVTKEATEIEMHGDEDSVDETDFSSIGKTLSKYGKGTGAEPVKAKRSALNTDYTMTGHKEGKSTTGRVYSKVLPDDEDAHKAAKATVKTDDQDEPKRGRGRPAGSTNKAGLGKGWSAEAKASMKAKLAARKAAKVANESEELDESNVGAAKKAGYTNLHTTDDGKVYIGMHPSEGQGKKPFMKNKATDIAADLKSIGVNAKLATDGKYHYVRIAEAVELSEEDWAEITEGHDIDSIAEFMLDEEYESLDELSKATLGSYIKKVSDHAASPISRSNSYPKMLSPNRQKGLEAAISKHSPSPYTSGAVKITKKEFDARHAEMQKGAVPARYVDTHGAKPWLAHPSHATGNKDHWHVAKEDHTDEDDGEPHTAIHSHPKLQGDKYRTIVKKRIIGREGSDGADHYFVMPTSGHVDPSHYKFLEKKPQKHSKGIAKAVGKLTKESVSSDHVQQVLADHDINSNISGNVIKVHSSNVNKTKQIVSKLNSGHQVTHGLNESNVEFYAANLSNVLIKD